MNVIEYVQHEKIGTDIGFIGYIGVGNRLNSDWDIGKVLLCDFVVFYYYIFLEIQ